MQRPDWAKAATIGGSECSACVNKSHSGDTNPKAAINVEVEVKSHRTVRDPPS